MSAIDQGVCNEQRSLLLSKIMDRVFVGTKTGVNLMRVKRDVQFYLEQDSGVLTLFQTGSSAEGFLHNMWSDLDFMTIDKHVMVTYPDQFHRPRTLQKSDGKCTLLMKEDNCRPGFVTLQLVPLECHTTQMLPKSIALILNSQFISSYELRKNMAGEFSSNPKQDGQLHGPCFQYAKSHTEKHIEMTIAYPCDSWPKAAEEWIIRTRVYGWPSEEIIRRIVQDGCHVVPIGDKCSGNEDMQWRISFATAERRLIYSITHVQFKVYGLLKYILKQIKDKLRKDLGDEDILCSYFLKTVLFHAVENSPESLWQEKTLFACFQRCFTMLVEWVHAGYCPHYFIPTCNLFQRKIHGKNQIKLLRILNDLSRMEWNCLSTGPVHQPSIWEHLHNPAFQEQVFNPSASELEIIEDADICRGMTGLQVSVTNLSSKIRKSLIILANTQSGTHEIFSYYVFAGLLLESAMDIFMEQSNRGNNKDQYKILRRCKHRLIPRAVFGTNILYLASFTFLTGNYTKTAMMCRKVLSSANLLNSNEEETKRYMHEYCGRGYTTLYKLQQAFGDFIMFGYPTDQKFCLPQLYAELINQSPLPLFIHPEQYAAFLSFLCCHEQGNIQERDWALNQLERLKHVEENIWVVHTLLGICYETKGDKHKAIQAYENSLRAQRNKNPAQDRINAIK